MFKEIHTKFAGFQYPPSFTLLSDVCNVKQKQALAILWTCSR